MTKLQVPFFRPLLHEAEVSEVVATLRSGWLTSGPRVKHFEEQFGAAIAGSGSRKEGRGKPQAGKASGEVHAVALNSGTAALHLAVDALGLKPGQRVLVPTMTFAATAEVVRYQGGIPILVDCDPMTLNIDLEDAARRIESADYADYADGKRNAPGKRPRPKTKDQRPKPDDTVGIMPVHVGGKLVDLDRLEQFAHAHKLWVVEDAAHAFPASWRSGPDSPWRARSNGSSSVTCYSFYANKTITTGEGGMAVTSNARLAQRIRLMSLHGLSADAWGRYSANGSWDYKIVAPGYKYNLTDIAAAIGIHQLVRAEEMRREREQIALRYCEELRDVPQLELPVTDSNRIDSWHLFAVKLRLRTLNISRDQFIAELKRSGVGCSVHWRPLHLHPYYQKTFGWRAHDCPVATAQWKRLISLPIFPGMRDDEIEHVIRTVRRICQSHAR